MQLNLCGLELLIISKFIMKKLCMILFIEQLKEMLKNLIKKSNEECEEIKKEKYTSRLILETICCDIKIIKIISNINITWKLITMLLFKINYD